MLQLKDVDAVNGPHEKSFELWLYNRYLGSLTKKWSGQGKQRHDFCNGDIFNVSSSIKLHLLLSPPFILVDVRI